MKDSGRYVKIVEWSFDDQCYVGSAPGLIYGGCHGPDEKEGVQRVVRDSRGGDLAISGGGQALCHRLRRAATTSASCIESLNKGRVMLDTLIKNGTIIDGTGSPRYEADVAIDGGRIAAIGNLGEAQAARTDRRDRAGRGARFHRHALALGYDHAVRLRRRQQGAPRSHHRGDRKLQLFAIPGGGRPRSCGVPAVHLAVSGA